VASEIVPARDPQPSNVRATGPGNSSQLPERREIRPGIFNAPLLRPGTVVVRPQIAGPRCQKSTAKTCSLSRTTTVRAYGTRCGKSPRRVQEPLKLERVSAEIHPQSLRVPLRQCTRLGFPYSCVRNWTTTFDHLLAKNILVTRRS
jgi:hypothetical protein